MFSTKSGGVGSSGISRGIAFRTEQIVSIAVLSVAYVSSSISVTGHPVTCTAVVVLQWLVGRIEGVCEDLGLRRVD